MYRKISPVLENENKDLIGMKIYEHILYRRFIGYGPQPIRTQNIVWCAIKIKIKKNIQIYTESAKQQILKGELRYSQETLYKLVIYLFQLHKVSFVFGYLVVLWVLF